MNRRTFLNQSMQLAGVSTLGLLAPQLLHAQITSGQLIFVFMRGGMDALALLPPAEAKASGRLKLHRPNEFTNGAIPFSSEISLHPLLSPLLSDPVLKSRLNFVLHSGSTYNTLSHFEQMARVETGDMLGTNRSGIFGRAAKSMNRMTFAIGNTIPTSLRGTDPLVLTDPAKLTAAYSASNLKPGPSFTRSHRLGMYKKEANEIGDANIDRAARLAQSQFDLIGAKSATTVEALIASNGYFDDQYSLGRRLATAAHMLSSAASPPFVVVDGELGWDTHSGQFTNDKAKFRSFASKAEAVGRNLAALKRDLEARGKWATTAVVVLSEFGRTVRENGSSGTDHGRGGVMMLMGGRIRPFNDPKYLGRRSWGIPLSVDVSTALDVSHDYRLVLAEILQKNCGMSTAQLDSAFLKQISASNYLGVI